MSHQYEENGADRGCCIRCGAPPQSKRHQPSPVCPRCGTKNMIEEVTTTEHPVWKCTACAELLPREVDPPHTFKPALEVSDETASEGLRDMRGARTIAEGILEATTVSGPWEWGVYVERFDGKKEFGQRNDDDRYWTPLIYGDMDRDRAVERYRADLNMVDASGEGIFRNATIVRRAISPWEPYED